MPLDLIDQIDRMIEESPCRLSIREIGDLAFGGFVFDPRSMQYLADVIHAGVELRKRTNLPLAVPVPPELGFFLLAIAAEKLSDERIADGERGIDKVRKRMDKIERRHGVGDRLLPWTVEQAPPEWQAANREWERIADELMVDALRPLAPDMADLFAKNPDEFDHRRECGRKSLARLVGREDVLRPFEDRIAELSEDD